MNLWLAASPTRQNFISLPSSDYLGFRKLGAEPQDRAALTRHLIFEHGLHAKNDEDAGTIKVYKAASKYWTEHSSRASLVSMARALRVPKPITDKMGWWAVGQHASEEYIRTYRVLISQVQQQVAIFIRAGLANRTTPDIFGEDMVIVDLAKFVHSMIPDTSKGEIMLQLNKFRTFAIKNELQEVRAPQFEWMELNKDTALQEHPAQEEESHESELETEVIDLPVGGDWVITTGAQSRKCLHVVGNCFRVPSIHYKKWCIVHDPVDDTMFRSACRSCFPRGYPLVTVPETDLVEEGLEEDMPHENELEITSASSSASEAESVL